MSHLRFDGQGAGLGERRGGNANSLTDYSLVCTCQSELGPVMGFFPNANGDRTVYCPQCKHVTIVDRDGKIAAYVPAPKDLIAKQAARAAHAAGIIIP
jgi:hypothetical protein